MVSGRGREGGCVYIISSFPAIIETIGERKGGRRGEKGEGESRIWWGEGRGNEVPYSGSFCVFCDQTLAHENFFLQNFLADESW